MKFSKIVVSDLPPIKRLEPDEIARKLGAQKIEKPKNGTYKYRDPEKRKEYLRSYIKAYMAKRRAKKS